MAAGIVCGVWYYLYAKSHEWTDDAFIAGHLVQVSPRVPGRVVKVNFTDNQMVKAGDVLVEIDPRDFQVRLDQARAGLVSATNQKKTAETNVLLTIRVATAALEQARAGVEQAEWGVEMAQAGLDAAQATAERAKATVDAADADAVRTAADLKRAEQLFAEKRITAQQMDAATAAAQAAAAQLEPPGRRSRRPWPARPRPTPNSTRPGAAWPEQNGKLDDARRPQRFDVAVSQYETANSEVERLSALVDQAELEFSYTKVLAPEDGRMARKTVEEGNFVQPGQALVALVPPDVWVVANFKETSLDASSRATRSPSASTPIPARSSAATSTASSRAAARSSPSCRPKTPRATSSRSSSGCRSRSSLTTRRTRTTGWRRGCRSFRRWT